MIKILDAFTAKSHQFVVKENDMIKVMHMIQKAKYAGFRTDGMYVGDCGFGEELKCWIIHTNLTTNQWCALLEECKNEKYQLVIKDDPNNMYVTKIGVA